MLITPISIPSLDQRRDKKTIRIPRRTLWLRPLRKFVLTFLEYHEYVRSLSVKNRSPGPEQLRTVADLNILEQGKSAGREAANRSPITVNNRRI